MDLNFVFFVSLVTAAKAVIDVHTKGEFQNVYFPLKGSVVRFKVKTEFDATITFTGKSTLDTKTDPYMEVGLGAGNNTSSFIRRVRYSGGIRWADTPSLVSDKEFRGFWIKLLPPGGILVGQDHESIPLMAWTDPKPFDITHFGVGTCCGTTGEWKVEEGDDKVDKLPCAPDDVRTADDPWSEEPLYMVKDTCFKILTELRSCGSVSPRASAEFNERKSFVIYDEKKSWDDAKQFCESNGQKLASVRNQEDQEELENIMRGYRSPISGVWIGANDRAQYNQFVWQDGTNDAVSFTNWESSDPPAHDANGKNCVFVSYVALVMKLKAFWFPHKCDDKLNFICESYVK